MTKPAFLMAALALWASAAGGEECAPCGAETPFPEAAEFLASEGFSLDDYAVLLTWSERPRREDHRLVQGFRLMPLEGGEPFDLYADADRGLLGLEDVERLGIQPKDWDLKPVEQMAEIPRALAKAVPERPVPMGVAKSLAPSERIVLPLLDREALLLEDALEPDKGAQRAGVFQYFDEPVHVSGFKTSHGAWRDVDEGWVWSLELESTGAVGQRIHFDAFDVPSGVQVIVYNASNPVESYGPLPAPAKGDSGVWTPSCFSERVVVECFVPDGVPVDEVQLSVDRTVFIYRDFASAQWAEKAAAACNLDVACYPTWSTAARGVGLIGTIGSSYRFCTGALLADMNPVTEEPYFLTANHCVPAVSEPEGIEIYWLYQTSTCGGVPPNVTSVPRTTGGADLLATSPRRTGTQCPTGPDCTWGNDFSLLRLREQPPAGLTYLGWSTVIPDLGRELTTIHHPRADYKRISFGNKTDLPVAPSIDSLIDEQQYHQVLWSAGTTEGGSSGCPLMLSGTQQVVGQLWGGLASCTETEEPDYYGRFDLSYPLIAQWLGPDSLREDIDRSGTVDAVDVQLVVNAALDLPIAFDADVNEDGKVDAVDVQRVVNAVLYSR